MNLKANFTSMKSLFYQCFFAIVISTSIAISSVAAKQVKPLTVGFVEKVRIQDTDTVFSAKLDTGAQTSSINAVIIEENIDSVVFEIMVDRKNKETKKLKKKIERYVRIKKKNHEGIIRRPVVKMTFCIAGRLVDGEVNLANREGFNYGLLIGRNMLKKGKLIVDASSRYASMPNCVKQIDETLSE